MTSKADQKAWKTMFDKPAPYCLVNNHVPQIKPTEEFHEWYLGYKKRVKVGVE